MASVNKVLILGNLGSDPELKVFEGGQPVAKFNVATNEVWVDKSGNKQERTEWHRIVVWGPQADFCDRYIDKGKQILVEGRLSTREWQDRDGHKRTTTEIVANNIVLLGRRDGGSGGSEGSAPHGGGGSDFHQDPAVSEFPGEEDTPGDAGGDDEVPF